MKKLFLVGTGPGNLDYILPLAQQAIMESSDIVGYGLYIDLLGDLVKNKTCHTRNLGQETERVTLALDLASAGRVTALVSSGDIGIYAMASLAFELLDRHPKPEWLEVSIETLPGVSAMQVAASKIGAPLGHDFCTISMSDLLTPWESIEKRLHAAGQGDFVVAIYNPISKTRNWQINHAREILLEYRPPETPVVIAKNLSRENEMVKVVSLVDVAAEDLDMLTTLIIGSSDSRLLSVQNKQRVYTPRGYSKVLK